MSLPGNIDAMRNNIFEEAHLAIADWSNFPWHRPKSGGWPDANLLNSSQAFCISVWGTFAAPNGNAVRSIVANLLQDTGFLDAVISTPVAFELTLENVDRDRLNEHPSNMGNATNLDALLRFPRLTVVVESKLTETFGSCSQPPWQCSGTYGRGSDLKTHTDAPCRLAVPDGRRAARTYWNVMRRLSDDDAYIQGQPCPLCRTNLSSYARDCIGEVEAGQDDWRAIFAYPSDRLTRSHIESVVANLRPEYRAKVLHLDYLTLANKLSDSTDPISKGLGQHMLLRLRHCGLLNIEQNE